VSRRITTIVWSSVGRSQNVLLPELVGAFGAGTLVLGGARGVVVRGLGRLEELISCRGMS